MKFQIQISGLRLLKTTLQQPVSGIVQFKEDKFQIQISGLRLLKTTLQRPVSSTVLFKED